MLRKSSIKFEAKKIVLFSKRKYLVIESGVNN